jgi:hypothetical protein
VQQVSITTSVILIVAIVAIAVALWMTIKVQRSKKLRSQFGPEYDRVVQERGNATRAEAELEQRAKRVEKFNIRPLSREECDGFAAQWMTTQAQFVDEPNRAVADADELVHKAMKARGYPVGGDFDERLADISVDHPHVVEHYRAAHAIAVRDAGGQTNTEDLRRAMKHYRELFEELLGREAKEVQGVKQ